MTLKAGHPFQILSHEDKLIITHNFPVTGEGSKITVFDLKTEEQQLIDLQTNLYQAEIHGDKLYSIDGRDSMSVYDLNDYSLKNSVDVHPHKVDKPFIYLACFFVNR